MLAVGNAPAIVTVELPAVVPCPARCPHCSHRAATSSDPSSRPLSLSHVKDIARQGAEMGVKAFAACPRNGDVSLEPERYAILFDHARRHGLEVKATSSCVSPEGLVRLLPYLHQLTVSIDGFDRESYSRFRPSWLFDRLGEFLDRIHGNGNSIPRPLPSTSSRRGLSSTAEAWNTSSRKRYPAAFSKS
jgi:MoaA/NifB/PqqE/SkfB family radical SAM enzyme